MNNSKKTDTPTKDKFASEDEACDYVLRQLRGAPPDKYYLADGKPQALLQKAGYDIVVTVKATPTQPVETTQAETDLIQAAARAAHEANRAWCHARGEKLQLSWEDIPHVQRASLLLGVRFVRDEPGSTPKMQHDLWVETKVKEGWMFGRVKDMEAKVHPCLVPYEELPPAQRVKDSLFRAVVRAMLKAGATCKEEE